MFKILENIKKNMQRVMILGSHYAKKAPIKIIGLYSKVTFKIQP